MRHLFSFTPVGRGCRRAVILFCLLLASLSPTAGAADYYTTLTITVTNVAGIETNGTDTLTVIGDTRTATNIVAGNPSKLWLGTNAHLRSATNLYTHLALYPFGSGATRLGTPRWGATNIIRLDSQINQSISASVGGVWGTVLVTTNYTTNTIPVTVPASTWTDTMKTNIGNGLVDFLDRAASSVASTATGLSNYVALYTQQILSNKVFYTSTNRGGAFEQIEKMSGTNATWTNVVLVVVDLSRVQSLSGYATAVTNGSFWSNLLSHARITNVFGLHGEVNQLTDGYYIDPIMSGQQTTNPIVWGSLFLGDTVSGVANAWMLRQVNAGHLEIYNDDALTSPLVITNNSGIYRIDIGTGAAGELVRVLSTLISTNLYALNISAHNVSVTNLDARDATLTGTNIFNGRIDLTAGLNSTLTDGYNSGVVLGSNVVFKLSGPTGAYTNRGFAAPGGPAWCKVIFDNPSTNMTIMNEDGGDTAANRIRTGQTTAAALLNFTNNPVALEFWYDTSISRWVLMNLPR